MTWEQRLDKWEEQYGPIIIFTGIILAIVVMLMLGLVVNAFGCSTLASDCAQMMLSDQWDKGYVLSIVEQCKK